MAGIQRGCQLLAGVLIIAGLSSASFAADIICSDTSLNYMTISDTYVSSCIDSGQGNIGNGINDDFLLANSDWQFVVKIDGAGNQGLYDLEYTAGPVANTDPQDAEGTFSFDAAFWDDYDVGAIGFKFGTGNEPDSWFVFELNQDVVFGEWYFNNILVSGYDKTGNGLSHVALYSKEGGDHRVPEPATIALLLLGLTGIGMSRKIKKA